MSTFPGSLYQPANSYYAYTGFPFDGYGRQSTLAYHPSLVNAQNPGGFPNYPSPNQMLSDNGLWPPGSIPVPAGYDATGCNTGSTGNSGNGGGVTIINNGTINGNVNVNNGSNTPSIGSIYDQMARAICNQPSMSQASMPQQPQQCVIMPPPGPTPPVTPPTPAPTDPAAAQRLTDAKAANEKAIKAQDNKLKSISKNAGKITKTMKGDKKRKFKIQIAKMKDDVKSAQAAGKPDPNAPPEIQAQQYEQQTTALKDINKKLNKVDSSLKKTVKKIERSKTWGIVIGIAAIVGTVLTAGALAPVAAASLGGAIAVGAASGAVGGVINGAGTAAIGGGSILKGALKGGLYGAAAGAVTGGLMHFASPAISSIAGKVGSGVQSVAGHGAIGNTLANASQGAVLGAGSALKYGAIMRASSVGGGGGSFGQALQAGFSVDGFKDDIKYGALTGAVLGGISNGVQRLTGGEWGPNGLQGGKINLLQDLKTSLSGGYQGGLEQAGKDAGTFLGSPVKGASAIGSDFLNTAKAVPGTLKDFVTGYTTAPSYFGYQLPTHIGSYTAPWATVVPSGITQSAILAGVRQSIPAVATNYAVGPYDVAYGTDYNLGYEQVA